MSAAGLSDPGPPDGGQRRSGEKRNIYNFIDVICFINKFVFIKDNSMGSEPDTDMLDQWGKFVPEIKTVSNIFIDPFSWRRL